MDAASSAVTRQEQGAEAVLPRYTDAWVDITGNVLRWSAAETKWRRESEKRRRRRRTEREE
jgi:hypothetical protein